MSVHVLDRVKVGSSRRSDAKDWAARVGRAGYVGRGALYVIVGWLAGRLAFGDHPAAADQKGALLVVDRGPLGSWLVALLGLLFAAYAAYRFALAILNPEDDGIPKRLYLAVRGVLYLVFAWAAWRIVMGNPGSGSSGEKQRDLTLQVLGWPFGRWIVVAVGLGVIGSGLWHVWRGVTGRFAKDLKEHEMPEGVSQAVLASGTFGSVARGVAFALVGIFLVHLGWSYDAASPVGLDESLARLAAESWGRPALFVVGIGLAAYGVFTVMRARYQRVMGQ